MTRKATTTREIGWRRAPLLAALAASMATTATAAEPAVYPTGVTVHDQTDREQRTVALLAQCKPNPRLSVEAESRLPIRVTRWGTSGPKILVIHGGEQTINAIGGGPDNFSGQKPLSEQGWRIAIPDRPGFGQSPSRGRDDQVADVRWITAMLRDSGGSNLWGHSFGGAEALLAAAQAPTFVRSLVLVEADLWRVAGAVPADQVPPAVAAELEAHHRALMVSRGPADFASNFLASFQPKHGDMKVWLALHALELAPGLRKKIGCGALQAHEASGRDFLHAIKAVRAAKIPVLVVTGGWSPSRDALGEWVAQMIGGKHVIVPSSNHLVMKANPEGFNARVAEFMRTAEHR